MNPFGFAIGVPQGVTPRKPAQVMRRGPQDIPSAPFGFAPPPSKMEQTLAILNEYNPLPAFERLLKSPMALGGPISEQDIADGLTVAGTVTGGSAVAPKPKNALNMGIRAFHGSPHSFDKFSMDKIGTGEGAQAYGHGLYFAENEGVAKGYRDALTDPEQVKIRINDKHIPSVWIDDLRATFPEMYKGLSEADQDVMDSLLGTMESAYSLQDAALAAESVGGRAKALFNQRVKPFVTKPEVGPGSMYEVNINADPNTFLDWDKPLSEQPEAAKAALDAELRRYLGSAYEGQMPNFEGRPAGEILGETDRNIVRQADKLREAGIPGIKYLDAGSRGPAMMKPQPHEFLDGSKGWVVNAQNGDKYFDTLEDATAFIKSFGEGTRNYVVFDDRLISIVRKYGIAGASAMLGYNILDGMDPAQADELKRIEGNQ